MTRPPAESVLTHAQRDRAESFGRVADEYERFRPGYPDELVRDLLAGRPAPVRVLDIGCGTGKAARSFAARGADVLGVEIDEQMAAVARAQGIDVEVAAFEQWNDAGRRFELLTCAQAWHWVDPVVGLPKAAGLLRPGGSLALIWHFSEPDRRSRAIVQGVYRAFAPELVSAAGAGTDDQHLRRVERSGLFARVTAVTYPAERNWPVAEWVGNEGTQSNYVLLGARRPALLEALETALREHGPTVRTTGGIYVLRADIGTGRRGAGG